MVNSEFKAVIFAKNFPYYYHVINWFLKNYTFMALIIMNELNQRFEMKTRQLKITDE